jgi:molybdate transport system regulatory protein
VLIDVFYKLNFINFEIVKDYKLTGRIWLTLNDETVLGEGKICLLDNIEQLGSLRKAAEEMNMSYRKAWFSINQINKTAKKEVVELIRGGKQGGHAILTPYGKELLDAFKSQKEAFEKFLKTQNQ